MNFFFWVKLYSGVLAAFLVIDMIWLGLIAKSFYRKHLGSLMRPKPNWTVALIFYMLFVVGILIFLAAARIRQERLDTEKHSIRIE